MESLLEQLKVLARKASTNLSTLQIQIDSSVLNECFCFSTSLNKQKFHSASVGKMMTMVLIVQAIEKGLIDWTSPICRFLDAKLLEGLFIFEEKIIQSRSPSPISYPIHPASMIISTANRQWIRRSSIR